MSAPRPCVTDPFLPLNAVSSGDKFPYKYQIVCSSMWYFQEYLGSACIRQLRMRLC